MGVVVTPSYSFPTRPDYSSTIRPAFQHQYPKHHALDTAIWERGRSEVIRRWHTNRSSVDFFSYHGLPRSDKLICTAQEFTSSASSPTSTRPEKAQRDTPYSPRPRLFDNLPLPSGPAASDVLSEADYRRLRTDSFRPSSLAGPLIASSVLGEL